MKSDGLEPHVVKSEEVYKINNTEVQLIPFKTGSINDIDSALSVQFPYENKLHTVLNTNDIIMNDSFITMLNKHFPEIDILLCGYTGAGPYPQT